MAKEKVTVEKNGFDKFAYWIAQIVFAALSIAGINHYLDPVDPILRLPISVLFVASLFYISIRNR